MPREEFDELERRRKERWERGGDYYSDEEPEDDDREPGPQREETIETLAYLLSITKGAATALYTTRGLLTWPAYVPSRTLMSRISFRPSPSRPLAAEPMLSLSYRKRVLSSSPSGLDTFTAHLASPMIGLKPTGPKLND